MNVDEAIVTSPIRTFRVPHWLSRRMQEIELEKCSTNLPKPPIKRGGPVHPHTTGYVQRVEQTGQGFAEPPDDNNPIGVYFKDALDSGRPVPKPVKIDGWFAAQRLADLLDGRDRERALKLIKDLKEQEQRQNAQG